MPFYGLLFLDLVLNLSLLISLTVISGFLLTRWPVGSRTGALLQGLLFGTAAVLGMLKPLNFGPGLIFDGRSVMISLCALYFGPLSGAVSAGMALLLRIQMGGPGMRMGVLVILSSLVIGIVAGSRWKKGSFPPKAGQLYLFGLTVHVVMVFMMLALPAEIRWAVFAQLGPTVLLLYPAASVLAGKILSELISSRKNLKDLEWARENLSVTLQSIGDAVIATDVLGTITWINPAAEALTGWSKEEAMGRPCGEVLRLINEETRAKVEDPTRKVIREGKVVGLANHTVLITKSGLEVPIADSGAPIRAVDGTVIGAVIVFRDQREERLTRRLMETRLRLWAFAKESSLPDFLRKVLDEIGDIVSSPLGFFHFIEEDQKNLSLQQWSTRTLEGFCRLSECDRHYPIDKAGVWVDALRAGKAVIHNDYAALPYRKGFPPGHAPIVREIVVPIYREGKGVAVLGLGNKPDLYTQKDVEIVSYLAEEAWDIVQMKRTQEALRESEERFRTTFLASPDSINVNRLEDGLYVDINIGFTQLTGYTREDVIGKTSLEIGIWADPRDRQRLVQGLLEKGFYENLEARFRKKDGSNATGLMSARVITLGGVPHILSVTRDITAVKEAEEERRRLEEQLWQAQKMESVGRLAGGVAHDFNNMLGVILGRTELALNLVEKDSFLYKDLLDIQKAAQRSAELTRQLLGFARRQTIDPKELNLNDAIGGMLSMLRRLIGEDIDLAFHPRADLWPLRIDPSQLDQILANLVVNARDAMPDGGKITIETGNAILGEEYCREKPEVTPGKYVYLSITDTGCGIPKEIQHKIFEPFFTTKEVGKGTGLGLATVYGIVKQNNGYIHVYSEEGDGSTFKVYLPAFLENSEKPFFDDSLHPIQGGEETVLFVEDEPLLLEMGERMLKRLGYRVLAAHGPSEALEAAQDFEGPIALLITDVVMPEMNGLELSKKIAAIRPAIKCLFTSGYTVNAITRHGVLKEGLLFIQKPFTLQALAAKIREALGE